MLTIELPEVDEYGLVRHHNRWVAVSPRLEAALRPLLDEPGRVVSRDRLAGLLWPGERHAARHLDTLMHRLREKLRPLGITIHTIRSQGFMLEVADPTDEGAPWRTS